MLSALRKPESATKVSTDWITTERAAELTGQSVRTWRWRAEREATAARSAGRRSLAKKEKPANGGKPIWFVCRQLDRKLCVAPTPVVRDDRDRASLLQHYPPHCVEAAYWRAELLRRWRNACSNRCRSGATEQEIAEAIIEQARETEGDQLAVSFRSLQAWRRAYDKIGPSGTIGGVAALIDRRGVSVRFSDGDSEGCSRCSDAVEYFYSVWHTESCHSVRVCHELTLVESQRRELAWPFSYSATRKWLATYDDKSVSCLLREGKDKWCRRYMPYNEIDYTLIAPGQFYQTDHHQCDFWVFGRDGKQIRPWLTVVQDMRSRAIVGWHLGPSPHQDAIIAAYLAAFRQWAIPETLRIDNGKDFTSKLLTGHTKATRDRLHRQHGRDWRKVIERDASLVDCVDPRFVGITEELGIETVYAIPYAPWSKGTTERWFGTFEGRCGKMFATYCGNSALMKPECLEVIRSGYTKAQKRTLRKKHGRDWRREAVLRLVDTSDVLTIDQAVSVIGDYVEEYHCTAHSAEDMQGRCPMDVWNTATSLRKAGEDELVLLMQSRGVYRVRANGVAFKLGGVTLTYGRANSCLYPFAGRDVLITIDPNEPDHCHAFTADRNNRRYIGRLDSNTRISPTANADELREANAEIGRRRKLMHQAQREAPKRTRTASQEMASKQRERVAALRATGTDSISVPVIAVRTGFEGASKAVRSADSKAPRRDRKARDMDATAKALAFGTAQEKTSPPRRRPTLDLIAPIGTLGHGSPEDKGEENDGKDADPIKPDIFSLVTGSQHGQTAG